MEEEIVNIIKCSISITKILYPKTNIVENGDFAIISAKVLNVEEGDPYLSKWGTISVKGKMCELSMVEEYNIVAKEVEDEKWGRQYEVIFIGSKIDLTNKDQQKIYLSKILTETQVDNLFATFDNPIDILDKGDIDKLCSVKGIKGDKAEKILEKYQTTKDSYKAYVELDKYGLTKATIDKLVERYGSPDTTVSKIQENPYMLIDEVDGIGWAKADNMALTSGLGEYSLFRVKAYIKYFLKEEANKGNTWSYIDQLCTAIDNVIGYDLPESVLVASLQDLEKQSLLWVNEGRDIIALKKYYSLEKNIAENLVRLSQSNNSFIFNDWEDKVHKLEKRQGWNFTEEQFNGVKEILEKQVVIVTGSGGTGKSSTVTGMLEAFGGNYTFAQTALSGRASGNLTDITGEEGFTIHRLLGVDPETGKFIYNKRHQLETDIIILDELSMIGAEIFYSLIQAIKTGAKLIMLGDLKQLEAIGIGNIMKDMIESGTITTVELTKIHRQAQASGIITESLKASDKIQLVDKDFYGEVKLGELQDMHLDIYKQKETTHKAMIEHFNDLISQGINKDDIQLIVPSKDKGKSSAYYLSNEVQKIVTNTQQGGITIGQVSNNAKKATTIRTLYVGDKIINMKNNYRTRNIEGKECPIFNGDLGIITEINPARRTITIKFNNKNEIIIPKKHLSEIWLGYAITTHKCLPKETYIYTEEGLKQLGELNNGANVGEFKPINEKLKVFNGQYLEQPSAFYNNGKETCKKVITKRGYEIIGTLGHGLDVLTKDGTIQRKNIENIEIDDYLLIAKNQNIYGNKTILNFENLEKVHNRKQYKIPIELTNDFAEFLGMMCADGVITKSGVALGKRNEEVVLRFNELVFNVFGYQGTIKKCNTSNMFKSEISSTFIRDLCNQITELAPNNKSIPKIILMGTKENHCCFLRGFFEDGTVRLKQDRFDYIEIVAKEYKMINTIKLMLLNMGIVSSISRKTAYNKKYSKNYQHTRLYIYKNDAKLFNKHIGFISYDKQEKLQYCEREPITPSSKVFYPYITRIIKDMSNKYNIKNTKYFKWCLEGNKISDYYLEIFLRQNKKLEKTSEYKYLSYLLNNTFVQPVVDITEEIHDTYCLTMPETHKFVQEGFLGWNCQGSSAPYIICGLDYTHYNLLNKEMVYTMITRAKKYCILCAENKALRTAIKTSSVKVKQTFLCEFLQQYSKAS